MPYRASVACLDCGVATRPGPRCPTHASTYNSSTHSSPHRQVYSTPQWRQLRRQVLQEHPWCAHPDCDLPATDVDHDVPLRAGGDPYDRTNLTPLCRKHHSRKTQREVFGRKA